MMMKTLLLFFLSLPALAYEFTSDFQNGFYWAQLPINITVIENDPARKQRLEGFARNAIAVWEQETIYKSGIIQVLVLAILYAGLLILKPKRE